MKLYAKVALGVATAFFVFFALMGVLKAYYVDPARKDMLREASAPGLELATQQLEESADEGATLAKLRTSFDERIAIEPRRDRAGDGWFVRGGEMYSFRQLDAKRLVVVGPFPSIDPSAAVVGPSAIGLAFLLTGLVGFWLASPLIRRIRSLEVATRQLADGDLKARASDDQKDAIGELSGHFNKMAAQIERLILGKRELLQAVSHEFRTPATRLRFELELLADSASPDERAKRMAAIDASLLEMDELVSELLLYTRFDGDGPSLSIEAVEPEAVVRDVADALSGLRRDVELRVESRAGGELGAHPRHFRRVIQNLVANALRHARHEVVVELRSAAEHVVISIRDDGDGIPAEDRERVFEPFARLETSRSRDDGGAGLGLAIVQRICQWHGASVTVVDHPRGACFQLDWPRSHPA